MNRRRGVDFPLLPPEEDAISIATAGVLRATFAQDDRMEARGVAALLNAVVSPLSGGGRKH